MDLTFTPRVNSLTVSVPIIDNGIFEGTEQFFGDLSTSDSAVSLQPQRTTIRITDDDGTVNTQCYNYYKFNPTAAVIGFTPDTYNVNEGDGSVSITFGVLSGTLGVGVDVSTSTRDGSAICKSCQDDSTVFYNYSSKATADYSYTTTTYTLSPSSPNQTFNIAIEDDGLLEDTESFTAGLIMTTRFNITIFPNMATINILDNDSKCFQIDGLLFLCFF